jgi:hypothetical protein
MVERRTCRARPTAGACRPALELEQCRPWPMAESQEGRASQSMEGGRGSMIRCRLAEHRTEKVPTKAWARLERG